VYDNIGQLLQFELRNGGESLRSDRKRKDFLIDEESNPRNGAQHDFIRLCFSEYSQNLTPLNENLKLVFLNSEIDNLRFEFPNRATHYAIFPKGKNQWEHVQKIRDPKN